MGNAHREEINLTPEQAAHWRSLGVEPMSGAMSDKVAIGMDQEGIDRLTLSLQYAEAELAAEREARVEAERAVRKMSGTPDVEAPGIPNNPPG